MALPPRLELKIEKTVAINLFLCKHKVFACYIKEKTIVDVIKNEYDIKDYHEKFGLIPLYKDGELHTIKFNHSSTATENRGNDVHCSINAHLGNNFVRAGFQDVFQSMDDSVIKPLFTSKDNKPIDLGTDITQILEGVLGEQVNFMGFRVSKDATPEQIESEYAKIVENFILASQSDDMVTAKESQSNLRTFSISALGEPDKAGKIVYTNREPEHYLDITKIMQELGLAKEIYGEKEKP